MAITAEMLEMFWAGGFMAIKVLGVLALWVLVAAIVNRSIS